MSSVTEDFRNAGLRIDERIILPLAVSDGMGNDQISDFVNDGDLFDHCDLLEATHPDVARYARDFPEDDEPDVDYIMEMIGNNPQPLYMLQVGRPVRSYDGQGRCHYSWGYYDTKWVSAPTLDEALAKAISWSEKRDAAERKKTNQQQEG